MTLILCVLTFKYVSAKSVADNDYKVDFLDPLTRTSMSRCCPQSLPRVDDMSVVSAEIVELQLKCSRGSARSEDPSFDVVADVRGREMTGLLTGHRPVSYRLPGMNGTNRRSNRPRRQGD